MWEVKLFSTHVFRGDLFHAFVGYGVALFLPSFFMRVHGFGLAETSTYLFFIGLTGVIGTYLGGYLSDRLGARNRQTLVFMGSRNGDDYFCPLRRAFLHNWRSLSFSALPCNSWSHFGTNVSWTDFRNDTNSFTFGYAKPCLGDLCYSC